MKEKVILTKDAFRAGQEVDKDIADKLGLEYKSKNKRYNDAYTIKRKLNAFIIIQKWRDGNDDGEINWNNYNNKYAVYLDSEDILSIATFKYAKYSDFMVYFNNGDVCKQSMKVLEKEYKILLGIQ